MLIVGGAGNNRGAVLGAELVWGLWSASGAIIAALFPPDQQARAAARQIAMIGMMLAAILLFRLRGRLASAAPYRASPVEQSATGDCCASLSSAAFARRSAFSLDFAVLYERGELVLALACVLGSVGLSIAALFAGLWIVRLLA